MEPHSLLTLILKNNGSTLDVDVEKEPGRVLGFEKGIGISCYIWKKNWNEVIDFEKMIGTRFWNYHAQGPGILNCF